MSRRKNRGLFGNINFGPSRKSRRKSKGLFNMSFSTRSKRGKKGSMAGLFKTKRKSRKGKGLFDTSNLFKMPRLSLGGLGISLGLGGGFFGGGGSRGRLESYQPTWEAMRAYLRSHDMNPYNRQHVLYYMMYMPTTEDARSLVDDIAAKGKGLASANQAVDRAAWAYEQWQTFKGSSDFMDVVLAVSKGEMSPDQAQNLTGHYSARGFEGVMYYLQDLASRVKK